MRRTIGSAFAAVVVAAGTAGAQSTLYRSDAFTVTDTSVRQGRFEAVALSRDSIVSTYPRSGREMQFRFSIDAQDNEFRPGTQHTVYIRPINGRIVSPVYVFGQESTPADPTPEAYATSEEGVAQVTLRLDMRAVLRSFARTGAYDPPEGPPITLARLPRLRHRDAGAAGLGRLPPPPRLPRGSSPTPTATPSTPSPSPSRRSTRGPATEPAGRSGRGGPTSPPSRSSARRSGWPTRSIGCRWRS